MHHAKTYSRARKRISADTVVEYFTFKDDKGQLLEVTLYLADNLEQLEVVPHD